MFPWRDWRVGLGSIRWGVLELRTVWVRELGIELGSQLRDDAEADAAAGGHGESLLAVVGIDAKARRLLMHEKESIWRQ